MTRINNTNTDINFNNILTGISIIGNILQQSGIMDSIWTIAAQQNSSSSSQSTNTSNKSTTTDTKKPDEIKKQPEKTNNEIHNEIIDIINNNPSIRIDYEKEDGKEFLENVTAKYKAIKNWRPDITDEDLKERLTNYIKGYLYHQQENRFGLQSLAEVEGKDLGYSDDVIINQDVKKANDNKDEAALKKALRQMSIEYIEFYDDNFDGKIDVDEIIRKEVGETKQAFGTELYEEEGNAIREMASRQIEHYDRDNDNKLDDTEIAPYINVRNLLHGDGSTLTYAEFNDFECAVNGDLSLTDEQKKAAAECDKVLQKYGLTTSSLPDDLSEKLNPDEITIVENGIEPLRVLCKKNSTLNAVENAYYWFNN